jgi:D-sedoheptulose 7-phosphate isomerase
MKCTFKSKYFLTNYFNNLIKVAQNIDINKINNITEVLISSINKNKNIFVAGNGGSASIANHLLCDFNKGIKISSKKKLKPKVISLANSIEIMTAISNDIAYEKVFCSQIENYGITEDIFQSIMHAISQNIRSKFQPKDLIL